MKIPRFLVHRQTGVDSTIAVDFVFPKISILDSYYLPITVSSPEVSFRTIASNRIDETWVPLSAACDIIGPKPSAPLKDFLDNCADGQRLDLNTSTTIELSSSGVFGMESDPEDYYAQGRTGSDTIRVGSVELANFEMNFVTETNTSFAHVGLGQGSKLLDRLKEEGHIAARAFSMFVGSNVSYAQNWDPDAKNASYPGNIVFGGYDFKKESDVFIRGDLVGGVPRVKITGIHVHRPKTVEVLMDAPLEAEIDTSNPWIYLPGDIASRFRSVRSNVYNETGKVKNRIYGNVTMTVRLMDDDARVGVTEFNVSLPESIWEKDKSYYRDPAPTKQKYWPVLTHNTAPAVLGLPFLKAIYLAINYDSNEFQISPASYSSETDILPFAAVAADSSDRLKSFPTKSSVIALPSTTDTPSGSTSSGSGSTPKSAIVGGATAGALAILGILGLIFFFVKKKKKSQSFYQIASKTPDGTTRVSEQGFVKAELPAIEMQLIANELPVPSQDHHHSPNNRYRESSANPTAPDAAVQVPRVIEQDFHELP